MTIAYMKAALDEIGPLKIAAACLQDHPWEDWLLVELKYTLPHTCERITHPGYGNPLNSGDLMLYMNRIYLNAPDELWIVRCDSREQHDQTDPQGIDAAIKNAQTIPDVFAVERYVLYVGRVNIRPPPPGWNARRQRRVQPITYQRYPLAHGVIAHFWHAAKQAPKMREQKKGDFIYLVTKDGAKHNRRYQNLL